MKKLTLLFAVISLVLCLGVTGFAQQTDENESLVNYEGLMSGIELGIYSPEVSSTVTQLIAEAVRLHGIYNGTGIENSYSQSAYLEYALENGLIYEGLFEDYSRGASRAESVYVLYNAVGEDILTPKINNITSIPDCEPSAGYYQPLLSFYNAGIACGLDEYGAFRPGADITNFELSEMLRRISHPEERLELDYLEYASDAAFYLIDDFLMATSVRNFSDIGSGWKYDYTGSTVAGKASAYTNSLYDATSEDNVSISRDIFPQYDGVLTLEVVFSVSAQPDGITFSLDDADGNSLFKVISEGGIYYGVNTEGVKTSCKMYTSVSTTTTLRITADLDNNTAEVCLNGVYESTHTLSENHNGFSRVTISTGIPQFTTLHVKNVHLWKNYRVNDVMRLEKVGAKPYGYDITGNITVRTINSNNASIGDSNSAKIVATAGENANAHKDFEETSGLVKLEAYMLLPTEDDGAYFTASYKGYPVFKIESKNGKFYYGETELYDFSANIWQCLHIEANTNEQSFLIRINGKTVGENLPFLNCVPAFDSIDIGITPDSDCVMWFDDVEIYELFEYDDYVPVPQKLETDYYISMSVCNLWRNGSHYGWEYIAPHDDLTTYLGYYDEGEPEAMDWEIKFLAEHGISFYNMCWYCPACPMVDPIKKPRMVDAFHDGYFNAKYSDMLDFTIMFENASFKTAAAFDSFKENVWPFWMEWYFKDDRYYTIDNKPFLVIYQYDNWIQMCYEEPITSDMTSARKAEIRANAIVTARELYDWMSEQLIEIGYDGLILTFTNKGDTKTSCEEQLAIGASGVFPYNWGSSVYSYDTHTAAIENAYTASQQYGLDLLSAVGIGFNHIGWKLERCPLISVEEFSDLLYWFKDDYLARYETAYANDPDNLWKSKFLQFATWNEYGEGHYLYPSNLNGFGYLDAIADVFGKDEHDVSLDVKPTEEQKSRVGHLFPGTRQYIRRQYYEKEEILPDVTEGGFDFTVDGAFDDYGIYAGNFVKKPYYAYTSTTGGYYTSMSNSTDPMIIWKLPEPIAASDYAALSVKLSCSIAGTTGTIYFQTSEMTNFSESCSFKFPITETGDQVYYISTATSGEWKGKITHLRIDPGNLSGNTVKFYYLNYMNYSIGARGVNITVDKEEFDFVNLDAIRSIDKSEIYVAPTEEDFFYRRLHMVYEWNRHTKKLRIDTPNGVVFDFEIGSDTVLVSGKEYELNKVVELYDGCPVLPLIFILDKAGYNYNYDFTAGTLKITCIDVSTHYFDIPNGDAEIPTITNVFFNHDSSGNNTVSIVDDSERAGNKVWYVDSYDGKCYNYFRTNFDFEAGRTYTLDFDFMLGKLSNGSNISTSVKVNVNPRYAATGKLETATSNHYDHNVAVATVKKSDGWVHVSYTFTVTDDYITTDLNGNEYQDTLCIYLNPLTLGSTSYGIDYYIDNFTLTSPVGPCPIVNGDAESDDMSAITGNQISIETETLADGTENRYYKINYLENTNKLSWLYFNHRTTYTPGMTYYFEVDVRLGTDANGKDARTSLSFNSRYYDKMQSHYTSNPREHTVHLGTFTTSDEWTHFQGSFTISHGYVPDNAIYFAFYSNPVDTDGDGNLDTCVEYMIDNIKVYAEKPEHFES